MCICVYLCVLVCFCVYLALFVDWEFKIYDTDMNESYYIFGYYSIALITDLCNRKAFDRHVILLNNIRSSETNKILKFWFVVIQLKLINLIFMANGNKSLTKSMYASRHDI